MTSLRLGRSIFIAGCLAIVCGCGAKTGTDGEGTGSDRMPVVAVRARAVELRVFDDAVTAPGQWRSTGELVLAAPFTALIDSLGPRIGDPVGVGQTCGWLITRESQAAVRGAELLLHQARDSASRLEAEQALRLARRDLVRVPLVSPAEGVVVRRSAEAGSQVAEGIEILAIIPQNSIVFEAHLQGSDAGRTRTGQHGVVAESGKPPRTVLLQRILPSASMSDQTVLAWLTPSQAKPAPELDRFGTAAIDVGAPRRAAAVPDSALVEDDLTGKTRIAMIAAGNRAVWVAVTLGAHAGGWREVIAPPLASGTLVLIEGQHGLPDSTLVRLNE